MTEVLGVVLPPPDVVAGVRLEGAGLLHRAVATLRAAVPHAGVITAVVEQGLADLVGSGRAELVLLVDSTFPFVSTDQVRAVLDAARPPQVAAVAVAEVTDTLKVLDPAGTVVTTLDRARYRVPVGPLAVTPAVLASCLAVSPPQGGPEDGFAQLVAALDRLVELRQVAVADPGRVACRVTDLDSADYAGALLASSAAATARSAG